MNKYNANLDKFTKLRDMRIVKLLNCYIVSLQEIFRGGVVLLMVLFLAGCGVSDVGPRNSGVGGETDAEIKKGEIQAVFEEKELAVFTLDIDGERFELEMPEQDEFTAFDVLSFYVEKQGITLKTKKYDFGIFIEGIGDKIGDKNNFWLYYVNDKPGVSSADMTVIVPGDVIKFEFSDNSPF